MLIMCSLFYYLGVSTQREIIMHYRYIIYSEKRDNYYSGQTKNVDNRVDKHNKGHSLATRGGEPWKLKKVIEFEIKSEAIKAENWIKRMKSH
ncbi:GIY-YIG nuclease family protein [Rhodohalobacter sulfatireducens]|uniref:GIY-YIG nuclease family protein n=1 Tax=Rhodohalobacter sulfatireducens TaxID=2911366 RepID=UPI0034E1FDA8